MNSSSNLENVFVDMQIKQPGKWDGKLLKPGGEAYMEAKHGLNPLAQGFSICAPYRSEPSESV